ncbi:MAG: rod shape-determining protein MreC [Polyangiaceae bacterium]|nr:rod shape-determining protein MreC [Polyangiaceae bacterium]
MQFVAVEVARTVSGVLEEYFYLVDVNRDNERLRMENARFREELRELRVQGVENLRLCDLLALRRHIGGETISAQVISKDLDHVGGNFRVARVLIDRGERDLVRAGMPVISVDGLVGQIRRAAGHSADVTLVVDQTSAVDVVIRRTGARGMLRGTGDTDRYACQIQYLERTDEVEVGDEVYTSGMGQRFPAAILVGRVSRVERREYGLYQEAEVTPAVHFSALEEVLILSSSTRSQLADAEREGSE